MQAIWEKQNCSLQSRLKVLKEQGQGLLIDLASLKYSTLLY